MKSISKLFKHIQPDYRLINTYNNKQVDVQYNEDQFSNKRFADYEKEMLIRHFPELEYFMLEEPELWEELFNMEPEILREKRKR